MCLLERSSSLKQKDSATSRVITTNTTWQVVCTPITKWFHTFCTNPHEVEVQLHATKQKLIELNNLECEKCPTPPKRMKVDQLTIDQDPQALKMGNFLKPYKCLGLGISNYHQLIGVFHLTGCAPSIDPT